TDDEPPAELVLHADDASASATPRETSQGRAALDRGCFICRTPMRIQTSLRRMHRTRQPGAVDGPRARCRRAFDLFLSIDRRTHPVCDSRTALRCHPMSATLPTMTSDTPTLTFHGVAITVGNRPSTDTEPLITCGTDWGYACGNEALKLYGRRRHSDL